MDYEREMKYFSDNANADAFAEKKGETRGVRRGREEVFALLEKGVSIAEAKRQLGLK